MATRRRRRTGQTRANVEVVRTTQGVTTQLQDPNEPTTPGRKPGRPKALTAALERRFIDCVKAGNYVTVCARYVGLSPRTVEDWIDRGRGHRADRIAAPEYARFARLVDEAKATAEVLVIGNLVARSKTDTRAAELFLYGDQERRKRWRPPRNDDYDDPPAGMPALSSGPAPDGVTYDQRQQFIVIAPEQVDGIVRDMLVKARTERAARHAAIIEPEDAPHDGTRIARLDGLRADEGETPDDD